MKVCGLPESIDAPDFSACFVDGRYNRERDDEVHQAFFAELKTELVNLGYTGKLTGEIVRFPIADGYAQYMVADGDRTTMLIHLPIHDAWRIPEAHARGLRKADIVQMVERERRLRDLFAAKREGQ